MDIILGATGRVGSALATSLLAKGRTVRAVVRNATKAERLRQMGAEVAVADYTDAHALRSAFAGGDSLFVLTAEDPGSHDGIAEASAFLDMCRKATEGAGIKRVIGLSSDGAQHATGTGFLTVSYMLEHAFDGLDIEQTFIRPSSYYSNWMMSLPVVKAHGILPTFFPVDFSIPMIAPEDVAAFAAQVFLGEVEPRAIHEITGPCSYTSTDIAKMLGDILGRKVEAQQTPQAAWLDTLKSVGFSPANAQHMAEMTAAVISGITGAEGEEVFLPTTFPDYAKRYLAAQ